MEELIEEKLITQILENPNEATNGLSLLLSISEGYEKPFSGDLFSKKYLLSLPDEYFEINNLRKLLKNLEELLIKKINAMAEDETNKDFYTLSILTLSLSVITYSNLYDKLVKNYKTRICLTLSDLILNDSNGDSSDWINYYLKKLSFN